MTLADTQFFTCFHDAPLQLECGKTLGPITIAYETYGRLSLKKDNAILICHALSGDAHAAFGHSDNPNYIGWWDTMVGPGKGIDTNTHFVICSNVIGGCKGSTGPNSINPATGKPYGLEFPIVTVSDMVKAQVKLIEHLGISQLKLVIGGSMGGMQAMEWAIEYPDRVRGCAPLASTARLSPQSLAFGAVGREAILSDSNTPPERGLAIARMIGHITYLSAQSLDSKFGRRLQEKAEYGFDFSTDFQVESYLKYQGDKFVSRFDANSYLYITKAMSYFDLEKKHGSLENAFKNVQAKFLIASINSDWLYPAHQSKALVNALITNNKSVTYSEIDSPWGHDSFLLESAQLTQLIGGFIRSL